MDTGSIDLKKLLCFSSDNGSNKEKNNRVSYSKETLIILSKNSPCRSRPDCLSPNCIGNDGLWDPEKWHRSFSSSSLQEDSRRYDNYDEGDSNVVLGPQRRSFQGGCHVASKEKSLSAFSRSGLLPNPKLSESRVKLTRQLSHETESHPSSIKRFHSVQHDSSEWPRRDLDNNKRSFEKPESYRRPRQDYKKFNSRRYNNDREYRDNKTYQELEPEWISHGPKSQFDTIELQGFDDPGDFSWMGGEIPMDDVPGKRKTKSSKEDKKSSEQDESPNTFGALEDDDEKIPSTAEELPLEEESVTNQEEPQPVKKDTCTEVEDKKEKESSNAATEVEKPDHGQGIDNEISQGSRFSRWFSMDATSMPDIDSVSLAEKLALEATEEPPDKNDSVTSTMNNEPIGLIKQPDVENKPASSGGGSSDLHGTDAFNRLIASIRASDKVKEQIQQRNQKMQALQSMMKATQSRDDFNLTSVESMTDQSLKNSLSQLQTNMLKQQLEKQKDAYQQKLRQMEQQQQKLNPNIFPNQDTLSHQGILPGFAGQSAKARLQTLQDKGYYPNDVDERVAATASLAAKLKGKKDESNIHGINPILAERLYGGIKADASNAFNEQTMLEKEKLMKLKRLQSAPAESSKNKSYSGMAQNSSLMNSSLAIAHMLAKAGVTEEQLKQLTLEQQELVISMVQNQNSQKDIAKLMNIDTRNFKPIDTGPNTSKTSLQSANTLNSAQRSVSSSSEAYLNGLLSSNRDLRLPNTANSTSANALALLADKTAPTAIQAYNDGNMLRNIVSSSYPSTAGAVQASSTQSRILPHNVMPIHPQIMSPVVPIVSPNLAPHMLTAAMASPHLPHLVQTPAPHPALLLQMQHQYYATHVAAAQQQQQQAVMAALAQKQQLASAKDAAKLQQSVQNMRIASNHPGAAGVDPSGSDRSQFTNPLSQWFSHDVLRQSQFPPVSQLTGQTAAKIGSNLHSADINKH
ncbi:uncharacterized protein LOC143461743 [Clavelina lepadiformis]|uniref:uncharacterized protein LOC143461743 n=1 Tax=Clavelina lepadiformis TaxID=159417 RepID=UPI004042525C